ncbi:MAG: DUF4339 domain-containing protein [Thermoguttaceae bacterium]|nr:DUF4339 domain-containing protein [Thermoguttaceae bacterium]
MQYYVQIFDKAFGPLTKEKIQRLVQLKKITRSSIVSVDGENWKTLESFPELAGSNNAPILPSQPMTQDSTLWNYSLDGVESVGPIPFNELYNLVKSGFLHPEAIVWKEGENESFLLRDLQEFADLLLPADKQSKGFMGRLSGCMKKIFPFRSHSDHNLK